MTLTGANAQPVIAEAKTLLVILIDHPLEQGACQGDAGLVDSGQQLIHRHPTSAIQRNADVLRLVAQHQTQQFARWYKCFVH
jgi:hypothetical protein